MKYRYHLIREMSCTIESQRHPTFNYLIYLLHIQLGLKRNLLDDRSSIIATGTEKASDNAQHPFLEEQKR